VHDNCKVGEEQIPVHPRQGCYAGPLQAVHRSGFILGHFRLFCKVAPGMVRGP
jgi:hypothetical protein